MELSVGGQILEGLSDTYHLRKWISSVLSMSSDMKSKAAASLCAFLPDTPGEGDSLDPAANLGSHCHTQ